jgi:hypothetical protein
MSRVRIALPLLLLAVSCTEPKRRVALTASVLHGSTPGVTGPIAGGLANSRALRGVAPAAGLWAISPDQARITITTVSFIAADGQPSSATLTNCVVNYTRSAASLTKLLDCPFTIDPGTYVALDVAVANSFDVLVDDQVNNIYSDPASPTKLSSTRPAGGPQMVNYSVTLTAELHGVLSSRIYLPAAVTIDSGGTIPTVSLVADMIHTTFVTATGSSMNFFTDLPLPGVYLIPSLSGAGRVEYYTSSGTALSAKMPGSTDNDAHSVRVFYASPPQPAYIISPVVGPSSAQAVNPAKSPVQSDLGFRAGGYAGLDASGSLCWALPTTFAYQSYAYLRRMQSLTTLGATTTVQTLALNGGQATVPTTGDTYASGCPTFTPTDQFTVTLVAK